MSLFDKIKKDRDEARRNKDVAVVTILSTLIGELERSAVRGDHLSDFNVIATIKKTIANIDQFPVKTVSQSYERGFLEFYLPKQLTNEELKEKFRDLKPTDMKTWMSYLRGNYAGLYDGKEASSIFQEYKNKSLDP